MFINTGLEGRGEEEEARSVFQFVGQLSVAFVSIFLHISLKLIFTTHSTLSSPNLPPILSIMQIVSRLIWSC